MPWSIQASAPAGIDADRGVEIEADRKAAPPRDVAAAFELPLGVPLQKFVKADSSGWLSRSRRNASSVGCRHRSGQSHHAPE